MKRYMVIISVISFAVLLVSAFAWAQVGNPSTANNGQNLYLNLDRQNEKPPSFDPNGFCPVERYGDLTYGHEYGPTALGDNMDQRWCW